MKLMSATLLLALAAIAPSVVAQDVPIPEKLPSPVSEEAAPTVSIRSTERGDVVEEYRQGGRLTMVKVTPVRGRPYYLYPDERTGRLDQSDAEINDVAPVHWVVAEWD